MHFPFSNPIELNHGGYLNIIDIYVATARIFGGKCSCRGGGQVQLPGGVSPAGGGVFFLQCSQ